MALCLGRTEIAPIQIIEKNGKTIRGLNTSKNNVSKDELVYLEQNGLNYNIIEKTIPTYNNFTYGYNNYKPYVMYDNGTVHGFTSSKYLKIDKPFKPGNSPWEINLKVLSFVADNSKHFLFGSQSSFYYTVGGELNEINVIGFGITSNGSSWDIGWMNGTTTIQTNTWYWIKISFTGTQYKWELSTDGVNYNLEASINNSTPIYQSDSSNFILGNQGNLANPWNGVIDLSGCNIKINDEIWWTPDGYFFNNEFTTTGDSLSISNDGIASGFNSNYESIVLSKYMPKANEVEIGMKFNRISTTNGVRTMFELSKDKDKSWQGFNIARIYWDYKEQMRLWTSSERNINYQIEQYRNYWLKCISNSSGSTLYMSTDGINYTQTNFITNNQFSQWEGARIYIGLRGYNLTEPGTYTNIDLSQTYIKVDGKLWWYPGIKLPSPKIQDAIIGKALEDINVGNTGSIAIF